VRDQSRIVRVQERRDLDCAYPRTAGPGLCVSKNGGTPIERGPGLCGDPDCACPRTASKNSARTAGPRGLGARDQGPGASRGASQRSGRVDPPRRACPAPPSTSSRTGSCGTGLCVSNNGAPPTTAETRRRAKGRPDEPRAKRPADAHRRRSTRLRASVQAAPVNCVPSLRSGSSARTSNGPVHAPSPPGPNSVQDRTVRVQQRRSGPNCACPTTAETRRRAKGRPDEPRAKRPADAHRRRSTRLRASVQAAPVNCVPSLRSGSSARTANGPVHAPSPTPRHRQDRTPGPNPRTELCPGPNSVQDRTVRVQQRRCVSNNGAQDRTVRVQQRRIQQRRSNGAA